MNPIKSEQKIVRKKYSSQFKDLALERSEKFKVVLMCRLLRVSVSGYYAWLNRAPSLRDEANMKLTRKIKMIFDDEKSRAGAPRIARRLKAEGELVS